MRDTDDGTVVFDPFYENAYNGGNITSVYPKEDLVRNVLMNLGYVDFGKDEQYYYSEREISKNRFERTMVRLGKKPKIKTEIDGVVVLNHEFRNIDDLFSYLQEVLDAEYDTAKIWDLAFNER